MHAGSVPFLKQTGIVVGGWLMAKSAAIAAQHLAEGSSDDFYKPSWRRPVLRHPSQPLPFAAAYAAEVTAVLNRRPDPCFPARPETLF